MSIKIIAKSFLIVGTIWLALSNFTGLRNNFSQAKNFAATPIITVLDSLSRGELRKSLVTDSGLDNNIIKQRIRLSQDSGVLKLEDGTALKAMSIDRFSRDNDHYTIAGWAYVNDDHLKSLIVERSGEVLAVASLTGIRPDVEQVFGRANSAQTGFEVGFDSRYTLSKCDLDFYIVTYNLRLYKLESCPTGTK